MKNNGPKVLIIDIETSPIEAYVWDLWDQNISVNQIKKDWKIISVAWKWLGDKQVTQFGLNDYSEFQILKLIRKALDHADIVVGQNSKKFDIKKINARFAIKHIKPPSSYQQIDTRLLAKKYFGFSSNSLEYLSDRLNSKFKKLKHKDFPGQELWTECLKNNKKAWEAMREYNIFDVLATEELYKRLMPYDTAPINFTVYYDMKDAVCSCGNSKFIRDGFRFTNSGKYQQYECIECGAKKKHWKNVLGRKVMR